MPLISPLARYRSISSALVGLFFLARAQGDHRVAVIVVAEYNFFYDAFEFLHSTSMGKPEASPS